MHPDVTLRLRDLHLLSTAAYYDLSVQEERLQSANDLATFFHRATRALAPDLFIEAGAKEAAASRRAARYLDGARIVAFEANPYTYERFRSRNEGHRVEYLHLALSDEPGKVTFNVRLTDDGKPRPDGQGSLLERDESFKGGFTKVTVEATTLDSFLADHPYETCALWADVEGATRQVLTGGRRTLDKTSILIVEVEEAEYWKGAWQAADVRAFLYDRGMVPLARDFQSRYQYNMIFVRESLLDHRMLRLYYAQYLSSLAHRQPAQPAQNGARHGVRAWVTERVKALKASRVRK